MLSEEVFQLDGQLDGLVARFAPDLVAMEGVGTDAAVSLLIAVGNNPARLDSETSFVHLCGVAPIPASSGRVVRHRFNRRDNRDANRTLYVVAKPCLNLSRPPHLQAGGALFAFKRLV